MRLDPAPVAVEADVSPDILQLCLPVAVGESEELLWASNATTGRNLILLLWLFTLVNDGASQPGICGWKGCVFSLKVPWKLLLS
ncbi:unnamed protein product [Darwinula stevensoni]|uniref:Uncharacterized protein n=1 Tax=Darwinula stevensoni TaxID=69355 RepID=A0A7R9AH26_9CRUS|nr:unnamed protein product [Darwinula stevensoni]CAG0904992.1 unnamed protein product [Darwinula stevensoni]